MDLRDFGTVHAFVGCSVSTKASLAHEEKTVLREYPTTAEHHRADPLNRPSATFVLAHWSYTCIRDSIPPLAENVQLLSGVFPGVYVVLAEPGQGKSGLDQDHQADLRLGPLQSTTMQAAEIAMFFRVAKTTFDHRSAKSVRRFGLVGFHPLLVGLNDLFPFQSLDGSTLLRILDTTLTQRTATAVLRWAVVAVLDDRIVVAPFFLFFALVIQSVPLGTAIRLSPRGAIGIGPCRCEAAPLGLAFVR